MALVRLRHSITLLTERRILLFIALDALFLYAGLMIGLYGQNGSAADLWLPLIVFPAFVVCVPMLSDTVAVERRSGTLDLALTSPAAAFYFERRGLSVCALLVAQGWLAMIVARLWVGKFAPSGPLPHGIVIAPFLRAATLHWALRPP